MSTATLLGRTRRFGAISPGEGIQVVSSRCWTWRARSRPIAASAMRVGISPCSLRRRSSPRARRTRSAGTAAPSSVVRRRPWCSGAGLTCTNSIRGEPTLHPPQAEAGWIEIPAGPFSMGAGPEGFAYDNERTRHTVEVGAFAIARLPVSNERWLRFSESGGYERRECWSQEGWAWKQEHDITHHPAVADGHPQAPVCHVSWFEADAFARAHDARLPSEAEWEKAASWSEDPQDGPAAVGQVWEWTATSFHGYPGFEPYPYREYSEVFFGEDYLVLRGGSWATHPRVAGPRFRNWDLPQRRPIRSEEGHAAK